MSKFRNISIALSIAVSASMVTGCGPSMQLPPQPMAQIPASDLQEPAAAPRPQRTPEGEQDGQAALLTQLELYDVTGSLRLQLAALRCKVRASQGMDLPAWCPLDAGKR